MRASGVGENKIVLVIDGQTWQQVDSLENSGPDDRHFSVELSANGTATLHFGDGEHGSVPPVGGRSLQVQYRPGSGNVIVINRSIEDLVAEDETQRFWGIYRGVVVDNQDPLNQLRLLVQVPAVLEQQPVWARACLPPGATSVPAANKLVWVMFEDGDPAYPVWMGVLREE